MAISDEEIQHAGERLSELFDQLVDSGFWVATRYNKTRTHLMQLTVSRKNDPNGPVVWTKCELVGGEWRFTLQPTGLSHPAGDLIGVKDLIVRDLDARSSGASR